MALTRQELDDAQCGTPGCTHAHGVDATPLTLHGRCHRQAPTWATYHADRGLLVITCAKCGATITEVLVARWSDAKRGS
jgi:hypothetical protein